MTTARKRTPGVGLDGTLRSPSILGRDTVGIVRSILWMSEPLSHALREQLVSEITIVSSAPEFLAAPRDAKTVSFMDSTTLAELDRAATDFGVTVDQMVPPGPVIAICNDSLETSIGWLPSHPWLSHVVSAAMLRNPMAAEHLDNVMTSITKGGQPRLLDWVGPKVIGRRIRLTQASNRTERLERMTEFFDAKGISPPNIVLLRDAADELLSNAFYEAALPPPTRAPTAELSRPSAFDMAYGCRDDLAIMRVRDPYGSLIRTRLIDVLHRHAQAGTDKPVEASIGGAGLWRVFSAASYVAISVVNNRHTEFLVGIGNNAFAGPRPFAYHLFFKEHGRPVRRWKLLDAETSQVTNVDHSIAIVNK